MTSFFPSLNGSLNNAATDKKTLRKTALALREKAQKHASPSEFQELSEGLTEQCLRIIKEHSPQQVCAYTPCGTEPGNYAWLDALSTSCTTLFLPLCKPDHQLGWGEYRGADELIPGAYDIPEPHPEVPHIFTTGPGIDVLFIPAAAASPTGSRLGRGAGYYDRLLAALATYADDGTLVRTPLLVGVVYDHEVLATIPVEDHDQPLDMIVTPTQMYYCTTSDA